MKKEQVKTCKTCEHFKGGQRELNYWKTTGFCTNEKFSCIYHEDCKKQINK